MDILRLFYAPGACSRVPLNALEELRLPFEDHPVALMRGEQRSPEYLAVNPKGKVPALKVGDRIITENPAILFFLATQFPEGKLLPNLDDPVGRTQALGDLVWCGSALHPLVRQIYLPQLFTTGDTAPVRDFAIQAFKPVAGSIASRLAKQPWWYGEQWSILDVYLCWLMGIAQLGGMPEASSPPIVDHIQRVRARPSFVQALAREQAAVDRCKIPMPPGVKL